MDFSDDRASFLLARPPLSGWAAPEKKTASGGVINLRQIQIGSALLL